MIVHVFAVHSLLRRKAPEEHHTWRASTWSLWSRVISHRENPTWAHAVIRMKRRVDCQLSAKHRHQEFSSALRREDRTGGN